MKNNLIKRYLTYIFVYTVVYFVFLFVMDEFFNGVVLEFIYRNMYWRIYRLVSENRTFITALIYVSGLILISVLHAFKFNKLLEMASNAVSEDEPRIFTDKCPSELRDFSQKLKEFKFELMENENARKLAEQQKSDLIVYLAHDLKTPLTSVIGYLSLLSETQDLPIEYRAKYVGIALDKAYRLENLINEFFEITRLNLQTLETQKSKINFSVLLMQVLVEFFPMFEEKNINIVRDIEPELMIYADADKLARVFDNLFRNAVNYSYNETDIICNAYKKDGFLVVTVKNKGDDIPKEKLERIFDKFYRADNSRRSSTGGSGLGLAFAKQIVELHKGTITASCNDGNTEFTVTIPL